MNGRKWDASGGGVAKGPIDAARCWLLGEALVWLEGSVSGGVLYLCVTKHGQDFVMLEYGRITPHLAK